MVRRLASAGSRASRRRAVRAGSACPRLTGSAPGQAGAPSGLIRPEDQNELWCFGPDACQIPQVNSQRSSLARPGFEKVGDDA